MAVAVAGAEVSWLSGKRLQKTKSKAGRQRGWRRQETAAMNRVKEDTHKAEAGRRMQKGNDRETHAAGCKPALIESLFFFGDSLCAHRAVERIKNVQKRSFTKILDGDP